MASFDIDCIIVGRDQKNELKAAIDALQKVRYSRGALHLYYVDRGSRDGSLEMVKGIEGVATIALDRETPVGSAYNAGWRDSTSPYIQFLSADSMVNSDWLEAAMRAMGRDVGALSGRCQPVEPHGSIFNWIDTLQWRSAPRIGGIGPDFLVRRELLEAIDGFDEQSDNPPAIDFAQAASQGEWKLRVIDDPMALYQTGRKGFRQWWRQGTQEGRSRMDTLYKTGGWRQLFADPMLRDTIQRGGATYLLLLFALIGWLSGGIWWLVLLIPAALILLSPRIFKLTEIGEKYRLSPVDAAAYGWHLSCIAMPRCWGIIEVLFRKLFPKKS